MAVSVVAVSVVAVAVVAVSVVAGWVKPQEIGEKKRKYNISVFLHPNN